MTELSRILKMTLQVIFSILNSLNLRRNIYPNIRKFKRENKPLFWQKSEPQMFFPIFGCQFVGVPQRDTNMASPY